MNDKSALPYVLVGCGVLLLVGLCAAAGFGVYALRSGMFQKVLPTPTSPPNSGTAPSVGDTRTVRATVTSVSGLEGVASGTPCMLTVSLRDRGDGTRWCQGHLHCGGRAIYGASESSGFFPCSMTAAALAGQDTMTTREDQDPRFSVDTAAATIYASDDDQGSLGAFSLQAHIDEIR